jgi:transcriptional regulator with XRE-family HTH domain
MGSAEDLSAGVIGLRARRELSQSALCKLAGVSRDTLSRIERCEADPTLSVIDKLAKAFGVAVSDLFVSDVGDDLPDDAELARLASLGHEGWVDADALMAAMDEASGSGPARYSRAGRPRLVR